MSNQPQSTEGICSVRHRRGAERLWGDGREAEAKALLDALDALNRSLDRIRIGESRRILH
nr:MULTISPECIES: hypothetical protein [unclassified Pseudomonas]